MGEVADQLTIRADEQRLKQALANLISNAVGSGSVGSKVEIAAGHEGNQLLISVSQTGLQGGGSGAEPADFGITTTTRASLGRGTTRGLGMALVKTLIELHGGTIETRNGPGYRMVVCRLPDSDVREQMTDVRAKKAVASSDI
jgi:signal transduction histidine kinase